MYTLHATYKKQGIHKSLDMKLKHYGFIKSGAGEYSLDRTIGGDAALELYKEIFSDHKGEISFKKQGTGRIV